MFWHANCYFSFKFSKYRNILLTRVIILYRKTVENIFKYNKLSWSVNDIKWYFAIFINILAQFTIYEPIYNWNFKLSFTCKSKCN